MTNHGSSTAFAPQMPNWLVRRAQMSGNQLAAVFGDQRWTYAMLQEQTDAIAQRLATAGVGEGSVVATLLRNGMLPLATIHALIRLGAIFAPLNTRLTVPELEWQLQDCAATLLATDDANATAACTVEAALPHVHAVTLGAARGQVGALLTLPAAGVSLRQHIDLAAVHSLVYTSGTTGRPKGALLTYGNHWWNAAGSAGVLGMTSNDRLLATLPLYHVGGMAIVFRAVLGGAAVVVQDGFDPVAVNAAIANEGVSVVSVVAAMLRRMLDAQGDVPYPPSLRCVLIGGGPVPQPLLEECLRRGIPVAQTYGLTESASQAATLPPEDALKKLGSAGLPMPQLDLAIDAGGRPAAPLEVGEILLRGPSLSPGYLHQPVRPDAWLRTGDLGWLDADGYLYIADRRDDLIISGGENVYPAEVEAALLAHPAVLEAGVIGVSHAQWGAVPLAVVTLRPGKTATQEQLQDFCAPRLAKFKVPVRILFRDELPRNAAGKLLRRELRRIVQEGNGQQSPI